MELISIGASVEASGEALEPERRRLEGLQLALRTSDGVPIEALTPEDRLELEPLLEVRGDTVTLTREGRLLANEVAVRLR